MRDECSVRLLEGLAGLPSLGRAVPSEVASFGLHRSTRMHMVGRLLGLLFGGIGTKGLSKPGLALLSTACTVHSSNLDYNGFVKYSLYGPHESINFQSLVAARVA